MKSLKSKSKCFIVAEQMVAEELLKPAYPATDDDLPSVFWPDEVKDFWDNEFKPLEETCPPSKST